MSVSEKTCPFCKNQIPYEALPWMTVLSAYDGKPTRRQMGPCPKCKKYIKVVTAWPDEDGDGPSFILEPVHPDEVKQVEH